MFFENDRIARKQKSYINSRACDLIGTFEKENLNIGEIKAALELLHLDKTHTEFYVDIINRALEILKSKGNHDK